MLQPLLRAATQGADDWWGLAVFTVVLWATGALVGFLHRPRNWLVVGVCWIVAVVLLAAALGTAYAVRPNPALGAAAGALGLFMLGAAMALVARAATGRWRPSAKR